MKADSEEKKQQALKALKETSKAAFNYMNSRDHKTWSSFSMAELGVATHSHITSNAAEGTNGVVVGDRANHPTEFVDLTIQRVVSGFRPLTP